MKRAAWIYAHDQLQNTRYALGIQGERMLAVIGANPSTAKPGTPDRTLIRIQQFAAQTPYDGWILFNLWPEITSNPRALRQQSAFALEKQNAEIISRNFQNLPIDAVWAAWGNIIETRGYLVQSLRALCNCKRMTLLPWLQLSPPTRKGHPRHPLYAPANSTLVPFEINSYLSTISDNGRSL